MAKILLVEDNEMNLDMLSRRLEKRGHQVLIATDGARGVELANSDQPSLILMDMSLPVMDGWEFRRRQATHAALAEIPVIVFSAAGRDRLEQIDADDYLSKPVDLDDLLERVQRFCTRSRASAYAPERAGPPQPK